MKICPKCLLRYSEMWNLCTACKSPLKQAGVLKRIFSGLNLFSQPCRSLIENVVEQANAIFLYLDKNLRPIVCNRAMEYITGYSREEIFKGDWLDFLFKNYPSRKEILRAFIESSLTSIQSRAYECAVTKKDGTECILCWRSAAATDPSGDITGVICTAYDITESKSSEENIAVQFERLRNIFASIKDYALITTNLEGKITYYEKGSVELFGWKGNATLKSVYVIFPLEERQRLVDKIKKSVTTYGKFEEEIKLLREDKEFFPAILTVTALLNNKADRIGYVYIARDITNRKNLEGQMVQAGKLAAIGQLAAGVAHEINNPLLVISGRLDMISAEDEKFSPEVKQTIETIKNQAERMRIIVDRLLYYSHKRPPRMDMVDINELLRTIPPLLAYHPEFKKIFWKEELAKELPKIKGDFNQLQEMFLNIGLNACQAMPEGGVITISSKDTKDGFIEVAVKDIGVGIKGQDLDKLFTPFFSNRDDGTGLGLAICQSIISSHGGKIKVESEPGAGSTFRISLPLKKGVGDGAENKNLSG